MSILAHFEQYADKTFADAKALYLRDFNGKDKERVEAALESTAPYVDHMRLIAIDNEAMEPFKFDRYHGKGHFERPAMAGTVNKELTQVITVLSQACHIRRWLPSIPKFIQVTGPVRRGYPLSFDEQHRLFSVFPTGFDLDVGCFAVNTGVRKEELFGLRWTDLVDMPDLGAFVFVLNDTKNGHSRAVIVNSIARRCVAHMRAWQAKHGANEYVFPKKMCPTSNGKTWIEAWKKAGLPTDPLIKRGIHNCRHTFAHRLRACGVPEEDRNSLLGHHNTNIAQHYAIPDLKRLFDAAELVTSRREMTVLRSAHVSKASMEASQGRERY